MARDQIGIGLIIFAIVAAAIFWTNGILYLDPPSAAQVDPGTLLRYIGWATLEAVIVILPLGFGLGMISQ